MKTQDLPAWIRRLIPATGLLDSITEVRHLRLALRQEILAYRDGKPGLSPGQYFGAVAFLEATDAIQAAAGEKS